MSMRSRSKKADRPASLVTAAPNFLGELAYNRSLLNRISCYLVLIIIPFKLFGDVIFGGFGYRDPNSLLALISLNRE